MHERPPPVLDYSPPAAAPPSYVATTVTILLHPSLAFQSGATASAVRWFARTHMAIAALMLGIGTHLYVAYLSQVELFGTTTGHWSDGWFWMPMTFAWYVLFAAVSRIIQWRYTGHQDAAEPRAAAPDRRTAVLLHCAHLLPPAVVILATVLVLYRLDWSWTIDASEPRYGILLASELVAGAAYLGLTFRIASRAGGWAAPGEGGY